MPQAHDSIDLLLTLEALRSGQMGDAPGFGEGESVELDLGAPAAATSVAQPQWPSAIELQKQLYGTIGQDTSPEYIGGVGPLLENTALAPLIGKDSLRKIGKIITERISPYGYNPKSFKKLLIRKPDKMDMLSKAIRGGSTKQKGWYPSQTAEDLGREFAYRKMFGLKPRAGAERLFTKTGEKTYKLNKKNKYAQVLLDEVMWPFFGRDSRHSVFGGYTRNVIPKLTKHGKPSFEIKYKDPWDFNWNQSDIQSFRENLKVALRPIKKSGEDVITQQLHRDDSRQAVKSLLQRYAISRITRPITFKGTISADDVWKMREPGFSLDEFISKVAPGEFKPSKAWTDAYNKSAGMSLRKLRMKRRYNTP